MTNWKQRHAKATRINVIADEYFEMAHKCVKTYLQLSKMDLPSLTKKYIKLSNVYADKGYQFQKLSRAQY